MLLLGVTHTPMPIASEVKKLMVRKLERDPLGAVDSTAGPSEVATQLAWGGGEEDVKGLGRKRKRIKEEIEEWTGENYSEFY